MADLNINTNSYQEDKQYKVVLDGMDLLLVQPGAKTEMKFGRAKRRIDHLDRKIEAGEETGEDLDQYDELEKFMFGIVTTYLKDNTKDNSKLEKWTEETPAWKVFKAFEEIMEKLNDVDTSGTTS